MAVLNKYYQALFPFLSSMDAEKVAAWRHFDCLITTNRSIVGKVILGPSHLMFVGKRLATSLSKLKHTYTFFSKYEEMHDIQRDNNGFFYRSNIVLLIGQDQLVTLSFRRNRDAVYEELILRCGSSKPILRSIFTSPSPRPRTFALPTLRGQSMDCLPTAKKGFTDNHKSLIMDLFPISDRRKSLQKDERKAKRESFLITRAQSSEPLEAKPKEKERRKTFFLERRSSPHFFRSKSSLALDTGEEEPILFDDILPITSQKLLALLFPDTRPDLKQHSLTLARDLQRRSLSIKKLLPRSKSETAASSMHLFALRVLGPEGPIYFSCREERDIQNDITIRVETQNTLMSRMRPFHLGAQFIITPLSNNQSHLIVKANSQPSFPLTCSLEYARAIIKARIPQQLFSPKLTTLPCPIAFSELIPTRCGTPNPIPSSEPTPPKSHTNIFAVVGILVFYALLYLQSAALSDIETKLNLKPLK